MAILIYPGGISGGSADNIVRASKLINYAIGMRATKKPLYWRIENDRRVRMHAIPVLENEDTYIIRYGWRGEHVLNGVKDLQDTRDKRAGMHIAANKLQFRMWAADNDISVPATWTVRNEPDTLPLPVVGRPLKHRKGRNYNIYRTTDEYVVSRSVSAGIYYSDLLLKESEYRVFTFEGYVWCVAQKNPRSGVDGYAPWNFSAGNATFKLLRFSDWPRDACSLARDACYKLNLLFAGVDVICTGDGKYYIVEVNNAPGIDGELKTRYFGMLLDDMITRWQDGNTPVVVNPAEVKRLRHPILKGV